MKKILIVCAGGLDATDPGSKEMRLLANELSHRFDVSFLTTYCWKSQKKQVKNFKTFYVKDPKYAYKRFMDRLNSSKHAVFDSFYTWYAKHFIKMQEDHRSFYSWLKKQKEPYDILLSVSNPFFNHEYANEIKERLAIKDWFLLLLDPYSDSIVLPNHRQEKAEKERIYFQKCRRIFVTRPILENVKHSPMKEFENKITVVPDSFIFDKTSYQKHRSENTIHLGYMGVFYNEIRNPEPLLKILSLLPDRYFTDFYFRGCEKLIEEGAPRDRVALHDLISDTEQYNKTVGNTDILISIGNTVGNQIPSKLYDCIGFGKPIIHFFQDETDYVIQKFSAYPGIRFIDYRLDPQIAAEAFKKACEELKDFRINYAEISALFPSDTLEFFLDCFLREINN